MLSVRLFSRVNLPQYAVSVQRLHTSTSVLDAASSSSSSDSDKSSSKKKAKAKPIASDEQKGKERQETASRLNDLLGQMVQKTSDGKPVADEKSGRYLAIPPRQPRVKAPRYEDKLIAAAKDASAQLGGDYEKTVTQLVRKVMSSENLAKGTKRTRKASKMEETEETKKTEATKVRNETKETKDTIFLKERTEPWKPKEPTEPKITETKITDVPALDINDLLSSMKVDTTPPKPDRQLPVSAQFINRSDKNDRGRSENYGRGDSETYDRRYQKSYAGGRSQYSDRGRSENLDRSSGRTYERRRSENYDRRRSEYNVRGRSGDYDLDEQENQDYDNSNVYEREFGSPTRGILFTSTFDLSVFNGAETTTDLSAAPSLATWQGLKEKQLKLALTHPPDNIFQEMIQWTEQGKLWKFPIDNEQGLEEEHNVHFSEHVFMERHLKAWCPKSGPIRHFMELVCVGLSKNPYMKVSEKLEHIEWYRDFFTSKQELLKEIGAIEHPMPQAKKQLETQ